jgi:transcription elongation factor GreA
MKYQLSQQKIKELSDEVLFLKGTRRKEIAEQLEYAKSLGDLSENAEYLQAREDQAKTEERISQIEEILKSAVVTEKHHSNMVEVGSTVHVKKSGSSAIQKYEVVGSEEADMAQGKISNMSPLGVALFGKKKGEVVKFKTPAGTTQYEIVDIE